MISGYLFWRALRATAAFFTYCPVPYLLQRCRPGLHFTFYFDQRRAFAKNALQKPVFYHLWFFFAITVIYLVSPLIQVKT